MQTEPEQWAVVQEVETVTGDFLTEPGVPFYRIVIDGYCADFDHRQAAENFVAAIQRAFEERERKLREAAEDQAWVEARELVRGTNADLCRGGAGQAYRLIIEGLTDAIHNRSLRTLWGRVEHRRARQALKETPDAG